MPSYIMSLDQGTTSSRACLVSQDGRLVAQVSQPFPRIFPQPGWVEHDPDAIWQSTAFCIHEVLKKAKVQGSEIAAIGITNQRETVVAWDARDSRQVMNAIVWQCRRTQDLCLRLRKRGLSSKIQKKTGLILDPYFSATKMNWILKNNDRALKLQKHGHLRFGTIDTFLLWKLSSGASFATDLSNASRTMLFNLKTAKWDSDLCQLFQVSTDSLAHPLPSNAKFGVTKGLQGLLPDGIPIHGIAGDQQAALFGQVAFDMGDSKCTFGTGSFLLMNTGNKIVQSRHGLLSTIAWQLENQKIVYALEGGAFVCGAAVQWLRDGLRLIDKSSDVEALASSVESAEGVEFVPALTGLGAPHWRPEARGMISGLTRGSTKAHIARATLEAMALQNAEILFAMQSDLGKKIKSMRVDGGASANNLLMQIQADYLGCRVIRPEQVETTAMGAAYLAGLGVGLWSNQGEIRKIWKQEKDFQNKMAAADRRKRLTVWKSVVAKA